MLDAPKSSKMTTIDHTDTKAELNDVELLARKYASLLESVKGSAPKHETQLAKDELWDLGTHVPPAYKEPVNEGFDRLTLSTAFEKLSEVTQIYRGKVKFASQLVLTALLSYLVVDFIIMSL